MEQVSWYMITLLLGVLFGIGFGSRMTTSGYRYPDRTAYREPVYWEGQRTGNGLMTFVAVGIFVLFLLGMLSWAKYDKDGQEQLPKTEQPVRTYSHTDQVQ